MTSTEIFRLLLGTVIALFSWETAHAVLIVDNITGTAGWFALIDSSGLPMGGGSQAILETGAASKEPFFATKYNDAFRPVGPGIPPIPGPGPDPTHFTDFGINRTPTLVVPVGPCPTITCPPALYSFSVVAPPGDLASTVPLLKEISITNGPTVSFALSGVSALVPTDALDTLIIQGMEVLVDNPFPTLFTFDTLKAFSITLHAPGVDFANIVINGGPRIFVDPAPGNTSGTFIQSDSTGILFLFSTIPSEVPEPSTLTLLGISSALPVIVNAWRRRKQPGKLR